MSRVSSVQPHMRRTHKLKQLLLEFLTYSRVLHHKARILVQKLFSPLVEEMKEVFKRLDTVKYLKFSP